MTASPVISVVMSTYKRPDFLERSLASVLSQTHQALEVIVADDGGGDEETTAVIEGFADPRVRHLARPERMGIFANNVDALRATTGAYVIKLDDDDYWHEALCATLLEPLEADLTLAVSFSDHWLVHEDGTIDGEATDRNSERWGRARLAPGRHAPFRHLAIEGTLPAQFATLFRRDRVDWSHFPPEVGGIYDRWLALLASRGGEGAYYVDERLAYYRIHDQSYTATGRAQMAAETLRAYELALADPAMADVQPRLRELVAGYAADLSLALLAEQATPRAEARIAATRSIRLDRTARGAAALSLALLPRAASQSLLRARR